MSSSCPPVSPARLLLPLLAIAAGCGGQELPGQYYDVSVDGQDNQCTGNAPNYHEEYEFRLVIDGNDIQLAVGPDIFATGTIGACDISYSSLAWSSYRDGNEIQWEILGQAKINVGAGGGCVNGKDWEGLETYLVTNSAHPDVSSGCTYDVAVTGTWTHEVQ
ncbi:MAG: hypothetical protein R3F59_06040 [Myxococcota bacterium]